MFLIVTRMIKATQFPCQIFFSTPGNSIVSTVGITHVLLIWSQPLLLPLTLIGSGGQSCLHSWASLGTSFWSEATGYPRSRVSQLWHCWHFRPNDSLFWRCPVHYRIFSLITSLYPLVSSSTPIMTIKTFSHVAKYSLEEQAWLALSENTALEIATFNTLALGVQLLP